MQQPIDFSTEFGQRVAERLKSEETIWMTTIGPENTPHPRPVWFHWDGDSFLIYSLAKSFKLDHMSKNSKVALNFNTDAGGEDVAVFIGEARLDPDAPPVTENSEYLKKYEKGIMGLEMTPKEFEDDYSVPLRVTPTKLRGF